MSEVIDHKTGESVNFDVGALVVKSNDLVEASYKLTLMEQQLILLAICSVRERGNPEDGWVLIGAQKYMSHFGGTLANAYGQLRAGIEHLYKRSITFKSDDGQWKGEERWISKKAYADGMGAVTFTLTPAVLQHITRLGESGEFTRYKIEQISGMTSVHAVRVYELLAQHLSIGKREMKLEELRTILGLTTEYKEIKDFKLRVLDVAMGQINAHTDLKVSYEQTKRGRVVDGFIFSIHKKPAPKAPKKPDTTTGAPVIVSDEVAAKGIQGLKNVLKGGKKTD